MTTTYNVKIESVCPMLHHGAHNIQAETNMKKKGGTALNGDPEEWKRTVYYSKQLKRVYLPASCLEACLIEAGKEFKITGRKTATKYVKSGVFCINPHDGIIDHLSFYVNGKPVTLDEIQQGTPNAYIDIRTVKNPSTKGRQLRYRAAFNNWSSEFQIIVNADEYINEKILRAIIEYAGMFVGVGDYRPRFGRFTLTDLQMATP